MRVHEIIAYLRSEAANRERNADRLVAGRKTSPGQMRLADEVRNTAALLREAAELIEQTNAIEPRQ